MRSITFDVEGEPIPQGSKVCTCVRGFPRMFESNKNWAKWRTRVAQVARAQAVTWTAATPLVVEMIFTFPYNATHAGAEWKTSKPDIDKLIRAVLDGITFDKRGLGVLPDDSQVVRLVVDKVYGGQPGVRIRVTDAPGIYTPLPLPE